MLLRKAKVVDETHLELSEPIQANEGRTVLVSVSETPEADMERKEMVLHAFSVPLSFSSLTWGDRPRL